MAKTGPEDIRHDGPPELARGREKAPGLFKGPARGAIGKAVKVNLAALFIGTGAAYMIAPPTALAFAAGFVLGAVNIFWLFRIASKGMVQPKEKVARFVATRYYLRFIITALVFAALIVKASLQPVPLVVGLSASVIVTLLIMIFSALKEAS